MMYFEEIYLTLKGYQPLYDLVSTRIYPLIAPQGAINPRITYQDISSLRISSLSGDSGIEQDRIQIDAWDTDYARVKRVSARIIEAMDASIKFKSIHLNRLEDFEPDTKLFRVSNDFSVWLAD